MATPKTTQSRKKKIVRPEQRAQGDQQPSGGWLDSERFSGQGSESALAHLRELEKMRIEKSTPGD